MAFDLAAAQRLIQQVRERSQGPGTTTLDALAAALDAAVHEVNALAGTVGGLQSALDGQREHAERSSALGHALQITAHEALDAAQAQERSALDSLAALLESATARLAQLEQDATQLGQALADAKLQAAKDWEVHQQEIRDLTTDLQTAQALAHGHAAVLAKLAALPWWKRVFRAE